MNLKGRFSGSIALAVGAMMVLLTAAPVEANFFTHILREAGEAGGKAASHSVSHLGAVGKAARYLQSLKGAKVGALAAHATPEGHWKFVNREGQVFTAGTPDEMQRVMGTLAPDAIVAGNNRMTLFVSEDSVFQNRSALSQLPSDAELHVVTDKGAFKVERLTDGAKLQAQLRPNIRMELNEQKLFDEAVAYLGHLVNKSEIRTIGMDAGGKTHLPSAPTLDSVTKLPMVEQIDPKAFDSVMRGMRGRTVVLTGEVENGHLIVNSGGSEPFSRSLEALSEVARDHDVNLVVLHSDAGRQPGARNWFWQKMSVGGMDQASKAMTQGDFIEALGTQRGGVILDVSSDGAGRMHFMVRPEGSKTIVGEASDYLGEAVGHVTGEIVSESLDIYARDRSAQSELDSRLIPGVPSDIQYAYLVSFVLGLVAWSTVRGWWNKLWPRSVTVGKPGFVKRFLRAVPREAVYYLLFLPVVALPAFVIHALSQFWQAVTAPFRWIHRIFLRREV